jgi:radical SAM protein with 4Fe4S-binding SPASM domain
MMKGYEGYISEFYNEKMAFEDIEIKDIFKFRSEKGKSKFPQCKKCIYNDKCEGIWKEYSKRFGYIEFMPITEHKKIKKNQCTDSFSFEISSKKGYFAPTLLRAKKIKEKFVIVSESRKFLICDGAELKRLFKGDIDYKDPLFRKLEKSYLIKTKNNYKKINEYLCSSKKINDGVQIHSISLTNECNLGCKYCQAKSTFRSHLNSNMCEKTAKNIINFIFNDASKNVEKITIEFQGGEPLLNFKVLRYIVEQCTKLKQIHKKTIDYIIGTNLTLMDEKKLNFIIKNKIQISTSIDGPKNIHQENRPYLDGESSLEDTLKWVTRINEAYNLNRVNKKVYSSPTFTKNSLNDFKRIINFYIKNNLDPIQSRFVDKIGLAEDSWKKLGYSPEKYSHFFKKYLNYLLELNKDNVLIRDRMIIILLSNIFTQEKICPCVSESCFGITSVLSYNSNGDVYPCEYFRYTQDKKLNLGNVKSVKFKEILNSKQNIKFSMNNNVFNKTCNTCVWKPFCGVCAFKRLYEGGTLYYPVEKTSNCKVLMSQLDLIFEKIIEDEKNLDTFKTWLPNL